MTVPLCIVCVAETVLNAGMTRYAIIVMKQQEKSGANRASIILFLHQREGCLLQTYSIFLWIFLFDVINDIKIIF